MNDELLCRGRVVFEEGIFGPRRYTAAECNQNAAISL